jgi:hypothetical protein
MFIAEYGSDAKMTELQKGDPKAKKAPEPKKYEERVKYLTQAYDALSSTYYGFFNYQRAAETYEKIAGNVRFDEKKRKDSARNAMILYANMGARPKMLEQHKVLLKLSPSADEKANADFLVADYDYRQWNPSGADSGQNKQTRLEAEMALGRFHAQNRNNNAASKYVLEASYKLARMKRAGNDPAEKAWLKLTVANWQAFDRLGTKNADGVKESNLPPYADYGAEADFALVDADMREKFDYQTNHHRYAGAVDEIVGEYEASGELKKPGQFQKSVKEAENWKNQLDRIVSTYKSVEWTPAALARQGSVYDSIRTALFETRAPALKYFTAREENLLKSLEQSGRDDLQEKADQYRDAKKDAWRERRDREIAGADEVTVNRYLTAVLIARQFSVRNAAVQNALSRLAYLENVLGAAKMRDIVSKVVDPTDPNRSRTVTYTDDQFAQWRTGMNAVPPINGRPEPAPVAP